MHFVERNLFASKIGMGQLESLASTIFEIIGQIVSASIIAVVFAYNDVANLIAENLQLWMILVILLIIILCFILAVILYKKVNKIQEIIKLALTRNFLKAFILNVFLYMIAFVSNGLIIYMTLNAIDNAISLNMLPRLFATNTVAWLIGFIIPGVPGGIGVRELVLTTMSNGTVYSAVILVAAVGQRIILILGDFAAYLISMILFKIRSKGAADE